MVHMKEIEIAGKPWTIKRWTVEERAIAEDRAVTRVPDEEDPKKMKSIYSYSTGKMYGILHGLKEAPKDVMPEITLEAVKNLDWSIGDKLFNEIWDFNKVPFGELPS